MFLFLEITNCFDGRNRTSTPVSSNMLAMQVINYPPFSWINILTKTWNFSLVFDIWGRVTDGAAADSRAQIWMKTTCSVRDQYRTVSRQEMQLGSKIPQVKQTRFTPGTTGDDWKGRRSEGTSLEKGRSGCMSSSTSELFGWLLQKFKFEWNLGSESLKQQLRAVIGQSSDLDQHHGQLLHKENSFREKRDYLFKTH